jgi:hypothetical protein
MRTSVVGAVALFFLFPSVQSATPLQPPAISPVNFEAPAFAYRSLDGKTHQLSELRLHFDGRRGFADEVSDEF